MVWILFDGNVCEKRMTKRITSQEKSLFMCQINIIEGQTSAVICLKKERANLFDISLGVPASNNSREPS